MLYHNFPLLFLVYNIFYSLQQQNHGKSLDFQLKLKAPQRPTVSIYISTKFTIHPLKIFFFSEYDPHKTAIKNNISFLLQALHMVNCDNLRINGITSIDSPRNHISIKSCNNVAISNINLIAPEKSPNTDGIDISDSTNINIFDSTIQTGAYLAINHIDVLLIHEYMIK